MGLAFWLLVAGYAVLNLAMICPIYRFAYSNNQDLGFLVAYSNMPTVLGPVTPSLER